MTFAERLQELRERAGLSQAQLANVTGIPVWTVRGYEQGRREPLWDVLFKLSRGLGVSCEAFAICVSTTHLSDHREVRKIRPRRQNNKRTK
jgi:transcriptional regulator with XRE-family HTH domain